MKTVKTTNKVKTKPYLVKFVDIIAFKIKTTKNHVID